MAISASVHATVVTIGTPTPPGLSNVSDVEELDVDGLAVVGLGLTPSDVD
jgi:hypothetical protein